MIKNISSKKLLIIITLPLLAAASYFFLKDTKKIEIKRIETDPGSVELFENTADDIADEVGNGNDDKEVPTSVESEVNQEIEEQAPGHPAETEAAEQEDEKEEKKENKKVSEPSITQKPVSWGYQPASGRKIDTIIIHSSYDALGDDPYDTNGLIDEYKQYGVAAHYLINRKGKIYQLVKDKNIAYHAGVSSVPDGRSNVNNFSIGIELMNMKDDQFSSSQYSSLNNLIDYLKSSYNIKYTLGHNQIAPERKDDPWNFKWSKLK